MDPDKKYECSKCLVLLSRDNFHEFQAKDRKRDVTSQCKKCRSVDYFSDRYSDKCAQCLGNRKLDKNKICSKCNAESGIRECRTCGEMLPMFLSFYGARKTCIKCNRKGRAKNSEPVDSVENEG